MPPRLLRLSLAAAWLLFDALPGPGVVTAAQALAAVCSGQGLDREAQLLEEWLSAGSD
jgi:hypothetical protein